MNRVKVFLITVALWLIIGFAVYGVICTVYGNVAQAKSKEAGCTDFATTGEIVIYHCVDDQGRVFVTNSMGFIASLGN